MQFIWDPAKAAINLRKHGVSFEEAQSIFADVNAKEFFDQEHSDEEDRFITIGLSDKLRLLIVVHTERDGDAIRLISARRATKGEARFYA